MKNLARALRKHQTDAERVLWYRLRNHQLEGCKFRRQQVIDKYIADFLCLEPKLRIELDGGQHAQYAERDAQRTQHLQGLGYRVLRFWNHDVLRDPDVILEVIRDAVPRRTPNEQPTQPRSSHSRANYRPTATTDARREQTARDSY